MHENEMFSREAAASLTSSLVRIPSVGDTDTEKNVARFVKKRLENLGFQTMTFEALSGRPNVVGILRGDSTSPSLMFNAHMDVVEPGDIRTWHREPFSGTVTRGKVYGRGSADTKGGLAAVLLAAESLSKRNLAGTLIIAAVVDEEKSKRGTVSLVRRRILPNYAVFVEPTDLRLCVSHYGVLLMKITVFGTRTHSSMVTPRTPNAIVDLSHIILALERYNSELSRKSDKILGPPKAVVGMINGGVSATCSAEKCSCTVDRRIIVGEDLMDAQEEILDLIRSVKRPGRQMKIKPEIRYKLPAANTHVGHPFVVKCRKIMRRLGKNDVPVVLHGSSDMPLLTSLGIPCVMLGPGSTSVAHAPNEWVTIKDVRDAAVIYAQFANDFLA
jgi:acetylornithine deacetylase/succinyl-diaminopimelate desuccinylase family protein